MRSGVVRLVVEVERWWLFGAVSLALVGAVVVLFAAEGPVVGLIGLVPPIAVAAMTAWLTRVRNPLGRILVGGVLVGLVSVMVMFGTVLVVYGVGASGAAWWAGVLVAAFVIARLLLSGSSYWLDLEERFARATDAVARLARRSPVRAPGRPMLRELRRERARREGRIERKRAERRQGARHQYLVASQALVHFGPSVLGLFLASGIWLAAPTIDPDLFNQAILPLSAVAVAVAIQQQPLPSLLPRETLFLGSCRAANVAFVVAALVAAVIGPLLSADARSWAAGVLGGGALVAILVLIGATFERAVVDSSDADSGDGE